MAYPIAPAQGFIRTPDRYRHDAFGHDGMVDGCTRIRPHSGLDTTPIVANARALSVLGGKVVRADWTIYAGNYVAVEATDGWIWLSLHLASRLVRPGDRVEEGDVIGIVGNTGGGGSGPLAGKTGNLGIHVHTCRCRDMAAVNRIVNGLVRARYKGETPDQWAAAHGLSDPYPHIISSLSGRASGTKGSTPTPTTPEEDPDMAFTEENSAQLAELAKAIPAVYKWVQDMQPKVDEVWRDVNALEWLKTRQGQEDIEAYQIAQLFGRLPIFDSLSPSADAAEIAKAVADKLAIPGVTPEVITQIAVAVNDEASRRLAD